MLANANNPQPKNKPNFLSRIISVLIRAAVLLLLLFIFDKLLPSISQQTQSFVMAKWQQLSLLQQELPTEDSLPSPLPKQHLTDTWGGARSQGRTHEGIDIFAPRGTPIQATTQGIVSKVGENTLGGRVVMIVGPGGAGHYYAHLEDYADIAPNDWVNAGDIVGYVGDSGNAKGTPTHVHYGIYINGSAVNPYPLLRKPES
ncbi:M23 family metallopeptidase [Psychrobacter sp. AOP22-C1-22]|uniref:M23 family metallopeptidase n=1 Tax=unclassified Psychrobacter TaxID=196806 RepID=UPI001787B53B|nr:MULTISPECIES: M23 family metallopeptidase [unclassified Psychrobacter]MDN5802611.1 M23 family metallopeptidase [Psychrobacter sp.]MBE0407655.1 M23 family metallopeptidase [Psychrobacter sp. FME6]MBE0445747.1 M23 family metallopeptidase [Psychrobacter sp. FME5]MDN5890807.1 M23 family metallopeptidase [Psychrobacter sp.]MDN5897084.1 M23 family metallopeptidase [Psychrobacter sp.]